MVTRTWARALGALGAGALAAAACKSEHYIDLTAFCADRPGDAECANRAGAAGDGAGGDAGGGTGGSPEMGTGGVGGTGGAGASGAGSGGTGGASCAAPKADCGGVCVDVKADDATNCGACGRACLGAATCAQGACVPEPLASGEVAPYALADDGTSLYWVSPASKAGSTVNDARMRRVPKAGGTVANVFDSTRVRARSLAFDSTSTKLYWGDLGTGPGDLSGQKLVAGLPGAAFPLDPPVAASQVGIEHLTLQGDRVYWLLTGGNGAVRSKLADGTGGIAPDVSGQTNPRWVVVDADAVPYWVAVDATGMGREVRRLVASPPNGTELVAAGPDVVAVELTAGRFYWANRAAGTVQSRPKATPTEAPRDEFAGQGAIEGFRVEGETLYVLTAQGRTLRAFRKAPGDAAPLLLGEAQAKADPYAGNPFGGAYVLLDAQYVYFADAGNVEVNLLVPVSQGDGVVYRVAK